MKSFMVECVDIHSLCAFNGLDSNEVLDVVSESDISFGTNSDTLVKGELLEHILEKTLQWGEYSNQIMVSLGC